MKIIKKLRLIIFFSFLFISNQTYANDLGFSVFVHEPKNQIDSKTPYLDLRVKPSETFDIEVDIKNDSLDKDLLLHFNYVNATTNSEGGLEYIPSEIGNDTSLKYKFEDIIYGPNQEELQPNEEKTIIFKLTMPKDEYDGYIAGGIEIEQILQETSSGTMSTEFSYVIGARISETDKQVKNELEFRKIQVELYDNQFSIMTYLANITSSYIEDLNISINITEPNKDKILLSEKKEHMRMAPNSQIAFPITIDQSKLPDGVYEAHISANTQDGFKKEWTQPFKFKIESGEGYVIEETSEIKKKTNNWIYILILSISVLVLGIVLFWYRYIYKKARRKRNVKKNKKRKR